MKTNKSAEIYQYLVLGSVVFLNGYILVRTGQLNETLTGALIGVLTGIGVEKINN